MEKTSNKYLLNIAKIAETAKENKWTIQYDPELDSLYWTQPNLSGESKLAKVSNEFALYISPAGLIEGLFIEYAKNNFISHNEVFRPIFEQLTIKLDDNTLTVSESVSVEEKKKLDGLLECMADMVTKETITQLLEKDINLEQALA